MNGVGDVQGDFASGVEDVFLAGFDAWGELGQVRECVWGDCKGKVGHASYARCGCRIERLAGLSDVDKTLHFDVRRLGHPGAS